MGPANLVDTSRYFVIAVDAIGDGDSTSPSNSTAQPRMQFPRFTIRDMVESQHRLVTDILHLNSPLCGDRDLDGRHADLPVGSLLSRFLR